MPDDRKYVRVYYSIQDDPKFDRVRGNVALLGTWLRCLMAADAVWPASADLPRSLSAAHVRILIDVGLVDELPEHRFRIHGLDTERTARRNAASNAAAQRWHSEGNADAMPSKAEPSRAQTSRSPQRLAEGVERNNNGASSKPWDARPALVKPTGTDR